MVDVEGNLRPLPPPTDGATSKSPCLAEDPCHAPAEIQAFA